MVHRYINDAPELKPHSITGWHGFVRAFDFIKATISLGLVVGGMVWAVLVYALDGKYAVKEMESSVKVHSKILADVQRQVGHVRLKLLQRDLVETKARSCKAASAEAKQHFAQQLQSVILDYQSITREPPFVPVCDDLQ